MNFETNALARMLVEQSGDEQHEAEALAARIAELEDDELAEAVAAWMLTGEERHIARDGIDTRRLVADYGFAYPNAVACLSQPKRVNALLEWL